MFTGSLVADLLLGDVHSLKEKRAVVRPVVAELRRRYAVAAAEVGDADLHRRAQVGVAAVAADAAHVAEVLDACERLIAGRPEVDLLSVRRQLFSDTRLNDRHDEGVPVVDPARARRLAVRIREIVASTLEMQVKDPRLGMVTITDARLTPDLRDATLYYTVYGDDAARAETAVALDSARGVLRTQVGRQTGVKFTPTLAFVPDAVPDQARRLDDLLAEAGDADAGLAEVRAGASYAGDPEPYRSVDEAPGPTDARPARPARPGRPAGRRCRPGWTAAPITGTLPTRDRAPAAGRPDLASDPRRRRVGQGGRAARRPSGGGARLPREPGRGRLGSMLALALALRRRGTRVLPSFSEPFEVPASLAGLPGAELLVPPGELPAAPPLLVTFDTGSADRLGSLSPLVDSAAEVLVVDHHASNTRYGTLHLVDPAAAATAVLVEELVRRLGEPLDADDRRLPVRGAGHRHRLVPVRGDHGGDPRAGRPAAAHRHPARPARAAAAGHPPRRLAVAWSAPRWPGPGWSRPAPAASVWCGRTPGRRSWPPRACPPTRRRASSTWCGPRPRRRSRRSARSSRPAAGRCRCGPRAGWTSAPPRSAWAAAGTASPRASPRRRTWAATVAAVREAVEAAPRLPP